MKFAFVALQIEMSMFGECIIKSIRELTNDNLLCGSNTTKNMRSNLIATQLFHGHLQEITIQIDVNCFPSLLQVFHIQGFCSAWVLEFVMYTCSCSDNDTQPSLRVNPYGKQHVSNIQACCCSYHKI